MALAPANACDASLPRPDDCSPPPTPPGLADSASPPGRAPPGLAGGDEQPLRGSLEHGTGRCVPCFWRWKPQGCAYGANCSYCHSCPEGEVKARRRARLVELRETQIEAEGHAPPAGADARQRQEADAAPPPTCPPPPAPPADEPSVGSALHASGECRPCSYFHRPGGCLNGAECRHCHLCPGGEIKARKKDKLANIRGMEPLHGSDAASQAPLPTLLVSGLRPVKASPARATPLVPPLNAGSLLHGAGYCKPCAFLWKPSGCGKGQACQHCHLCPAGELQARRRAKQAMLRETGGGRDEQAMLRHLQAHGRRLALSERARAFSELLEPMSVPLPKLSEPAFVTLPAGPRDVAEGGLSEESGGPAGPLRPLRA